LRRIILQARTDKPFIDEWAVTVTVNGYRLEWDIPARDFADCVERVENVARVLALPTYEIVRIQRGVEDIPF
jgi:hypothetical protein